MTDYFYVAPKKTEGAIHDRQVRGAIVDKIRKKAQRAVVRACGISLADLFLPRDLFLSRGDVYYALFNIQERVLRIIVEVKTAVNTNSIK